MKNSVSFHVPFLTIAENDPTIPISNIYMKTQTLLALFLGTALMHAAETNIDPKAQTTVKNQVTSSQIGYRDTLLFYTFAAEKAVLVIQIDNKSGKFPMTGKLNVFAQKATAEDLANWINNQHSCGLFPDVPEPVATHLVPAASYSVVSKKIAEVINENNAPVPGKFNRYEVEFKIENVPALGEIKIKDFTDTANVFVKTDGAS